MQEAEVAEPCVTQQGITLQVRAVIAFKVGDDNESIANAGRRFLDDQDSMPELVGRIFAGHLRSVVGSMTVEDIIRERQKLAAEVLDASKPEMAKLGFVVDAFQIESIDDGQAGYIKALSQPHIAAVNQNAQYAQAQADQASSKVRQESDRNQADYQQQTAVAKAEYQAQIDRAQQTAAQAGPLAQAKAQQDVLSEQAKVAQAQAELRRQQLVAEVVRPAEAEAEKVRTLAKANADAIRLQAEATASSGGVVLERMLVEKMPEILGAAAGELRQANVTILNGSAGLGDLVAGLAAQATSILEIVRKGNGKAADVFAASLSAGVTQEPGCGACPRADQALRTNNAGAFSAIGPEGRHAAVSRSKFLAGKAPGQVPSARRKRQAPRGLAPAVLPGRAGLQRRPARRRRRPRSPHSGSGRLDTATSPTPGCWRRMRSTAMGHTFSPL